MFPDRLKVLAAGLLALSVAGAVAADKEDKPTDEKKILGTRTIVSFVGGGKKAKKEAIKDVRVTFSADGKMTVTEGAKEQEFTYTLNPTQKLKEFNGKNSRGRMVSGSYKLGGGELTVCHARRGDRPTEFASEEGTSVVLQVLQREKN